VAPESNTQAAVSRTRPGRTISLFVAVTLVMAGAAAASASSPSAWTLDGTPTPAGLGDILFMGPDPAGDGTALFTTGADGSGQRLVHDQWDGIGLSRDGSMLMSRVVADDGRLLPLLMHADGSGAWIMPLADPTLQLGIGDWSPTGERLVFDGWDATDPSRDGLYLVSTDGASVSRLTDSGSRHDWPAYGGSYSPDGDRILFLRPADDVDGDGVSMDLFTVAVDGSSLTRLNPEGIETILLGPSGATDWSPDGTRVAFVGSEGDFWETDLRALFVVGADGAAPTQVTEWADILSVQWSPDGSMLAFTMEVDGRYEVFTVRPDGVALTQVTAGEGVTFSFGPMWSPDSRRLLFMSGTELRSAMDLWTANADGSDLVRVTDAPAGYGGYDWVP